MYTKLLTITAILSSLLAAPAARADSIDWNTYCLNYADTANSQCRTYNCSDAGTNTGCSLEVELKDINTGRITSGYLYSGSSSGFGACALDFFVVGLLWDIPAAIATKIAANERLEDVVRQASTHACPGSKMDPNKNSSDNESR